MRRFIAFRLAALSFRSGFGLIFGDQLVAAFPAVALGCRALDPGLLGALPLLLAAGFFAGVAAIGASVLAFAASSVSELRFLVILSSPLGVRNIHATIFAIEFVERRGAQAMPATHPCSRHPSTLPIDHPNNLGFSKTALSHPIGPSKG